ncbi:hypothetical protein [Paludisphaera rhizosphaerae]|uniref:hypothetical protein n=1 Tax=Paludisphaera rhizosphaerae TaxID=2711216 RepID=UPI0013ECF470|nr:hypothetical protein [Paludisphaera rhizosphaerae]
MRSPSRLVPGLLGLALAAPVAGVSAQEYYQPQAGKPAPILLEQGQAPAQAASARPVAAAAPKHEHKGLLGRMNCTECQRQRAMERDGIKVPPPPAMPAAVAAHQHSHGHVHAQPAPAAAAPGSTGCVACEADAAAMGGTIVPGSIVVTDSAAMPPGRAVVGGTAVASEFPTGRAVVGGAEPTPVGMARASQGNFTPVAGALAANRGAQGAPRDPSVMPSSMIPPAQTAVGADSGVPRPHIIKHALDLPDLGGIRRSVRQNRERASRESHASISYDAPNGKVDELPASMVYGKGGR